MPLNFDEPVAGGKYVQSSSKTQSSSKARRSPLPKELETEVLPIIIKKVGDWKSGRISLQQVQTFLDRNSILFDRETVKAMFAEADFRKEGSIDRQGIVAALTGRYPSRKHNENWRTLVSLIIGVKTLTLSSDRETDVDVVLARPNNGQGTFNSDSFWNDPMMELPLIRRSSHVRARPTRPGPLDSLHPGDPSSTPAAAVAGVGSGYNLSLEDLMATDAHNQRLGSLSGWHDFTVSERSRVAGSSLRDETLGAAASLRHEARDWNGSSSRSARGGLAGTASSGFLPSTNPMSPHATMGRTASYLGSPKTAYHPPPTPGLDGMPLTMSRLPPSPVSVPPSALQTLRSSLRSTVTTRPEFLSQHRGLDSSERDLKTAIGQPMDLTRTLSREGPVRPDKVLYNADYVTWSDYQSRRCRTAPTRWYNLHPAIAPVVMAEEHKYPWC